MSGFFNRDRNRLLALEQELQARRASMKSRQRDPKVTPTPTSPTTSSVSSAGASTPFKALAKTLALRPSVHHHPQSRQPRYPWQTLAAQLSPRETHSGVASSALSSSRPQRLYPRRHPKHFGDDVANIPEIARPAISNRSTSAQDHSPPEHLPRFNEPEVAGVADDAESWQTLAARLQTARRRNTIP
jgi:hypothetical protein